MHNNEEKTPRKMHGMGFGPKPKGISTEKAKDFKLAIKRLFKELNAYKVFIFISIILAIFGSVLSIVAPDKLSNLTDEISKGLVVREDRLKELSNIVISNQTTGKNENTNL